MFCEKIQTHAFFLDFKISLYYVYSVVELRLIMSTIENPIYHSFQYNVFLNVHLVRHEHEDL